MAWIQQHTRTQKDTAGHRRVYQATGRRRFASTAPNRKGAQENTGGLAKRRRVQQAIGDHSGAREAMESTTKPGVYRRAREAKESTADVGEHRAGHRRGQEGSRSEEGSGVHNRVRSLQKGTGGQ